VNVRKRRKGLLGCLAQKAIPGLQASQGHLGAKVMQAKLLPMVMMGRRAPQEHTEKMEYLVHLARLVQKVMLDIKESLDLQAQQEQMANMVQWGPMGPRDLMVLLVSLAQLARTKQRGHQEKWDLQVVLASQVLLDLKVKKVILDQVGILDILVQRAQVVSLVIPELRAQKGQRDLLDHQAKLVRMGTRVSKAKRGLKVMTGLMDLLVLLESLVVLGCQGRMELLGILEGQAFLDLLGRMANEEMKGCREMTFPEKLGHLDLLERRGHLLKFPSSRLLCRMSPRISLK
jgi:hypothetical protein